MTLYEKIISIYPTLTFADFMPITGTILLQDDSDGKGEYIKEWTNGNPEPTQAQLDAVITLVIIPPTILSMRQARLALFQQGLLANVQTAIDGLAEPQKTVTQISWDYAQTVKRDDDLVVQLSTALGLTQEQLDTLFTEAATL
jgi:hypothetical protein